MSVIFNPQEARESLKEFDGQVIEIDYSLTPFNLSTNESITNKKPQLCLKIQTDIYEKPQYIWLPPSAVKQTKWVEFLSALAATGALAQIKVEGNTDEEKIKNFGQQLIGMKFHLLEKEFTSLVKENNEQKKFSLLVPTTYFGKLPVVLKPEVKSATIGEELK